MAELRRRLGFWRALGHLHLRDLAAPEFAFGFLIGGGGAWYLATVTDTARRVEITSDFLSLSATLVGLVFAGFALVISLMSDRYLNLLRSTKGGVVDFLNPFMIATGLQVATVLSVVVYRAVAFLLPGHVEPWIFGALCVLFFVSVLNVVALARSVMMHGVARAASAEISDLEEKRQRNRQSG